jgi:LysM repeat protein
MTGASHDSASRMRRATRARGMALLVVGLLASTGCATISEILNPPIEPSPAVPRAVDREAASPSDDLCQSALPSGTNRIHIVRAGETLSEIAVYYRVLVSDLYALNPILDPDRIEIGQGLSLPSNAVVPTRPLTPRRTPTGPTRAQILMAEAEAAYEAARFERALALSQDARALMEAESDRSKQLAHAAFLAGSALAGLGEDQRASEEFDRVHALDAQFEPPQGWLSPRLGVLYGDALAK